MKAMRLLFVAMILIPLMACGAPVEAGSARPNIVFILLDDADTGVMEAMPKLQALIAERGMTLDNAIINVSSCCASRASGLRGQYAQNTDILSNSAPLGGWKKFRDLGEEKSTVATWLKAAGYRTFFTGKYLNGYSGKVVPPGWTDWYACAGGDCYGLYDYKLNENGTLKAYGHTPADYGTDVYAKKAVQFIQRSVALKKPFFAYISAYSPHAPLTPAPRYVDAPLLDVYAPRDPSVNEADVLDKPPFIASLPAFTDDESARLDEMQRTRVRSVLAVDDLIEKVVNALAKAGQLENTYIFVATDNGQNLGQHRVVGWKYLGYEPDTRAPLYVRGPGIAPGSRSDRLVGNIDLAPTFAALGGAATPKFVDGRSLVPLLRGETPAVWRNAYVIQGGAPDAQGAAVYENDIYAAAGGVLEPADAAASWGQPYHWPAYRGLRTTQYKLIEHATGDVELYDLWADPFELQNIAGEEPGLGAALSAWLHDLSRCKGAECRRIEEMMEP